MERFVGQTGDAEAVEEWERKEIEAREVRHDRSPRRKAKSRAKRSFLSN